MIIRNLIEHIGDEQKGKRGKLAKTSQSIFE